MEGTTSTPTTSTGTTSAPASTPSTGTTPSATATPTPAERPTFAQAFAQDAAPTTPDASTTTDTATTQPVDTQALDGATNPSAPQGPVPLAVHQKALENARLKAAQEAQAAFDRDYGWAKQVPREQLERFGSIASSMTTDPIGFLNKFVAELQANPVHAAALRSNAGRMLAARQANAEPQPDVQIVNDQGQVTGRTYSAEGLAKRDAWREKQLLAKVEQQYGPLIAEREQRQTAEKTAEAKKQIAAKAEQHFARVDRILDGDKSLYPEVNRLMAADPTLDAVDAALEVRKTKIAPAAKGKAEADVLESLKTKAAAQAMNPATAAVAATSRPKSFNDPSLKW